MTQEELQAQIDAGVAAFQAGDYQTAVSIFRSYLSHDPNNADVWWNVARSYELSQQWQHASDAFGHYIELEVDPARRAEGQQKQAEAQAHAGGTQEAGMSFWGLVALGGLAFFGWKALTGPKQNPEPAGTPDYDDDEAGYDEDEGYEDEAAA